MLRTTIQMKLENENHGGEEKWKKIEYLINEVETMNEAENENAKFKNYVKQKNRDICVLTIIIIMGPTINKYF